MVTHIDIIGIGNKKLNTNNDDFCSLDEYVLIAKKTISSYASKIKHGLAEEMLRNDDAIANIAHAIMMADWQFDGRGNKFGFRKERAKYAIHLYISRRSRESRKKIYQLDNLLNDNKLTFADTLEDKNMKSPSDIVENNESRIKIVKDLERLGDKGIVSKLGVSYLKMHYLDGKSMVEIANSRGVSRQSVSDLILKSVNTVKDILKQ